LQLSKVFLFGTLLKSGIPKDRFTLLFSNLGSYYGFPG
jgi:hypothetical protein